MSNPFTRFLLGRGSRGRLDEFIRQWDIVETLVVSTFRQEGDPGTDALTWQKTRAWLLAEYPEFEATLAPFWKGAKIAGKPAQTDPFLALLTFKELEQFEGNWTAMQILPAAREAINRYLSENQMK